MKILQQHTLFFFCFCLTACDSAPRAGNPDSHITSEKITGNSAHNCRNDREDTEQTYPPQRSVEDFAFDPEISVISGTLTTALFYGPPGYGETPEDDSRENVYVLVTNKPVTITASEDDLMNTTVNNCTRVQLTSTTGIQLNGFKGKNVRLTGTFFSAHTGHHYTDVLMDVRKIEVE